MTQDQNLVADLANSLFARLGPHARMAESWRALDEVALSTLLVPEELGGFGGSWYDALQVWRLAGYHALGLPAPEAMLCARLADRLEGRGALASSAIGEFDGDRFSGVVHGVTGAESAAFVIAPRPGGGGLVIETESGTIVAGVNLSGESRDEMNFAAARCVAIQADVFALGAAMRAAQIAGALDAALALSVAYVNERQQFGRSIGKFQAVQHALAGFASEAAATNCAAMGAFQALTHGYEASMEIAAAKLRANRAIGVGVAVAHQVHGAIGFTQEYGLHPFTRRLWTWRSEFGSDAYWSERLGARLMQRGADRLWTDLVTPDWTNSNA